MQYALCVVIRCVSLNSLIGVGYNGFGEDRGGRCPREALGRLAKTEGYRLEGLGVHGQMLRKVRSVLSAKVCIH